MTLGILGGMGVQATARFYELLTAMQNVKSEQEYLDVLIYSKSSIPDRTGFITGESNVSPLDALISAAVTLENAGVNLIAMPCVTAHFFYKEIASAVAVPFIDMVEETARYVNKCGHKKIGLLATEGTLRNGMLVTALEAWGVEVVTPAADVQARVGDAIGRVKRGDMDMPVDVLDGFAKELCGRGAEAVVLGCTELGLMPRGSEYVYIEALEVLACSVLAYAC